MAKSQTIGELLGGLSQREPTREASSGPRSTARPAPSSPSAPSGPSPGQPPSWPLTLSLALPVLRTCLLRKWNYQCFFSNSFFHPTLSVRFLHAAVRGRNRRLFYCCRASQRVTLPREGEGKESRAPGSRITLRPGLLRNALTGRSPSRGPRLLAGLGWGGCRMQDATAKGSLAARGRLSDTEALPFWSRLGLGDLLP